MDENARLVTLAERITLQGGRGLPLADVPWVSRLPGQ
jgi:hypothetical protein